MKSGWSPLEISKSSSSIGNLQNNFSRIPENIGQTKALLSPFHEYIYNQTNAEEKTIFGAINKADDFDFVSVKQKEIPEGKILKYSKQSRLVQRRSIPFESSYFSKTVKQHAPISPRAQKLFDPETYKTYEVSHQHRSRVVDPPVAAKRLITSPIPGTPGPGMGGSAVSDGAYSVSTQKFATQPAAQTAVIGTVAVLPCW